MAGKKLDPTFEKVLNCLMEAAKQTGAGLTGEAGTALAEPNRNGPDSPGPDRFKPKEFVTEYSRNQLTTKDYPDARKFEGAQAKNGSAAEVVLVMRQFEFMGVLQRDYMWRKCGRLQMEALASVRATNLGNTATSAYDRGIRQALQKLIALVSKEPE